MSGVTLNSTGYHGTFTLTAGGYLYNTTTGAILPADGATGVSGTGGPGTVVNAGSIFGGQGAYTGYIGGNGGGGILLSQGGTIDNRASGTIAGGQGGIGGYAKAGGAGGYGIELSQAGSIDNAGRIVGGAGGAGSYGGSGGAGGAGIIALSSATSLGNSGTIAGGAGGDGGNGTYNIAGGAGGAGDTGIILSEGGSLGNGVLIAGGAGGHGGSTSYNYMYGGKGGAGGIGIVALLQSATIDNSGTIAGGAGGAGGAGFYAGAGGNGATGVVLSQGGSLGNSGLIAGGSGGGGAAGTDGGHGGNGGAGIMLSFVGTVSNTGTIVGGAAGAGGAAPYPGAAGAAGIGIGLADGGDVANGDASHGGALIGGGIGVAVYYGAAGATVTNYGTIAGTGGTAVQFADSHDALVVEAGSRLVGTALGAGGTLDLAGDNGAGTLSGLGAQYAEFSQLAVLAGADWTLTDSGDVGTFSLADGGSLEFQGATADSQTLDFLAASGLAALDAPLQFAAAIDGFQSGDTIELTHTAATDRSYSGDASGGTLTVLDGDATVASLAFAGAYGTEDFQLSSDVEGNSYITLASVDTTVPSESTGGPYSGDENSTIALGGLSVSASPSADDPLQVVLSVAHGTLSVGNQSGATVTLSGTAAAIDTALAGASYTGALNYYGPDTLSMTATDTVDDNQVTGAASIAVADATVPNETTGGPYSGDENSAIALGGLSVSASPNADDPLQVVFSVAHGTLSVGNQSGATVTLSGTAATIDAAFAGAFYTGAGNYVGPDTLSMTTTDTVDQNEVTGSASITINPQNITIGNGSGTIIGGNGNDTITGSNGNDTVTLGSGNDTVTLGQGSNTITLGAGNDTVSVGNNNDTITIAGSATSTDSITAGNGNNTLNLGVGTYAIVLGNGANVVNMAGGTYDVTAGHGADQFVFETPTALLDLKYASNDQLVFRNAGFDLGVDNGKGTASRQAIDPSLFSSHTDGTFATPGNRFAYNARTGQLYYDSGGSTAGSTKFLVADLTNDPHLGAANLFFIS